MPQEMSEKGTQVLVDREGLRTTAYYDSVGVLTIGVGHTSSAGDPKVYAGMTITEEEAMEIFDVDNDYFERIVNDLVTVSLTEHEFDALVSFVFNIGETQFRDSTMLKMLNAGDKAGALEQFKQWRKPPEIIPRRRGEYAEFGYGIYVARIDDNSELLDMGEEELEAMGEEQTIETAESPISDDSNLVSINITKPAGIEVVVNVMDLD
jgi:GH24 family phage-related lysozyme (muramidase)